MGHGAPSTGVLGLKSSASLRESLIWGVAYGVTVTRTVLDLIMAALSGSALWTRT